MWALLPCLAALVSLTAACTPSITKVSGTHAPYRICSGALIFADDFYEFDMEKWQHEITLGGGGNWEFQYYNNNRSNSFAHDGRLFIRPSLLSDDYGIAFISSGRLNVEGGAPAERCTNPQWWGCERTGNKENYLNPIKSARIRTVESFNFRYGKVEVRAKMAAGDWLWPSIWLLPSYNAYGKWPASGQITMAESRGNRNMTLNGVNIGTQEVRSAVWYGPYSGLVNPPEEGQFKTRNPAGFDTAFHNYQLEWTPDYIKFSLDNEEVGRVNGSFWTTGGFDENPNIENPWRYGTRMAPFDQKFYLIINLAVGGVNGFFPDAALNPKPKPWKDSSGSATNEFWRARTAWLPTWNLKENDGQDASLQVDYVRVWAL